MGAFIVGSPALAGLADDPIVGGLAVSAAAVAGWTMPIGAPLFVADGIFFGLLAFGTIIASTALGSAVLVALISLTPLGASLDGIWLAIGAMLAARGLVFVVGYRRAVPMTLRS